MKNIEDVAAALRRRKLAIQRGHALATFARIDRLYREKFNPNHEPGGSPEGGQFAEGGGGAAGGGGESSKPESSSGDGKLTAQDKGTIKSWINATAGSAEFGKMRTDPAVIATMQKLPTRAGTIYRGTTFTSKGGSIGSINVGKISNLKVGQVIELSKLSSASTNAGTAVKFAVGPHQVIEHGKIGIKKGFTPVVFAMEQKTGHQLPTKMDTAGEKEVVTMPHTKFKITEITEKEHLKNPKVGKWPYVEIHMVET
jgi:hypothetical protein